MEEISKLEQAVDKIEKEKKRKANYKDIRANKKLVWHGKH